MLEYLKFYPCENCIFYNCEVFLSPDISADEVVRDIGTMAECEGLESSLRELEDEIMQIQEEISFIDRQGRTVMSTDI